MASVAPGRGLSVPWRGVPGCEFAACGSWSATVVRAPPSDRLCVVLHAGARSLAQLRGYMSWRARFPLVKHSATKGALIPVGGDGFKVDRLLKCCCSLGRRWFEDHGGFLLWG